MKKIKLTKESIALILITILSAVLNFVNLGIEGTANTYYAAAVKSMTMSFKNFFFVSFDPSGFVSIDKPPLGYWLQAISAKLLGFSGFSIILPQALAGVISVVVIYHLVKKSFGSAAGLISALCLTVTPVFVAVSRNNTVDNVLVLALLLACWALSIAAEKGRFKYLALSMVLIGIGFNIKMLQAYMVIPAIYITYLLANGVSFKKRIIHLAAGTAILVAVSLSWALAVDSIPASSRPYVDSSTNNTVMELITGHNGLERVSLSSSQNGNGGGAPGGNGGSMQAPPQMGNNTGSNSAASQNGSDQGFPGNPPSDNNGQLTGNNMPGDNGSMGQGAGGNGTSTAGQDSNNGFGGNMPGGGPGDNMPDGGFRGAKGGGQMGASSSNLQGTFGAQTQSGITRLFSKNILSDQIVWFIPLAVFGFIAAAIKEKLRLKLDNKKKIALSLWFMWFLPVFIYFSYNTGTFHSYYLTMLAPPVAALAGIGITSMWELYKEVGWKSWFLPASLIANGIIQALMLSYFMDSASIVKVLLVLLIALCFGSSIILSLLNLKKKVEADSGNKHDSLKKAFAALAFAGLLLAPFTGSAAVLNHSLSSSFPAAGLELLSGSQSQEMHMDGNMSGNSNSDLVNFLLKNKTASQKYLLVVSSANDASDIIIQTGQPVMAIGGFLGSDNSITLDQFKELVKKGEIRYVMTGGNGGGGNGSGSALTQIMNWVQQNGAAVSSSEYSSAGSSNNQSNDNSAISTNSQANGSNVNSANTNTQTAGSNANSANNQGNNSNANSGNSQADNSNNKGGNGLNPGGFGGRGSGQLYDLKAYTDSVSSK